MIDHISRYAGAYARGFIYALIAGLTVWATAIGDKAGPELWSVIENRWPALMIASIISMATVIRAQLDLHLGRVPPKGGAPSLPPQPPTK
jgi:hypothetical protein